LYIDRRKSDIFSFDSLPYAIFLSVSLPFSRVVTIHSFDDVSQCVDTKFEDATTITAVAVAVATAATAAAATIITFAVLEQLCDLIKTNKAEYNKTQRPARFVIVIFLFHII
jgi:hypothetical protein